MSRSFANFPMVLDRRRLVLGGAALAATSLASSVLPALAQALAGAASGKRRIGSFEVSPFALGTMNAAWGFGAPMAKADAARLFRHAADVGVTLFDTAEPMGLG